MGHVSFHTNTLNQSQSQANSRSAGQEIIPLLRNVRLISVFTRAWLSWATLLRLFL